MTESYIRLPGIYGDDMCNTNLIRRLTCDADSCTGNIQERYPSKNIHTKNFLVFKRDDPVTYENLNSLYNRSTHYDAKLPRSYTPTCLMTALAAGVTVGAATTAIILRK